MTSRMMTKSQQQRYVRMCEEQGINVLRMKKGLLVRFPNGDTTIQHFTVGDSRAQANQIAKFRRAGMVHPDDTRVIDELPAYIKDGTVVKSDTRKKIIDAVIALEVPDFVYSGQVVKKTKLDAATINRALYKMGFKPGKAKSVRPGRPWYLPDDLIALRPDPETVAAVEAIVENHEEPKAPTPLDIAERARKAQEAVNELGAGKPVTEERDATPEEEAAIAEVIDSPIEDFIEVSRPEPVVIHDPVVDDSPKVPEVIEAPQELVEDIQFIDERDSWTVDLQELLGGTWYILEDKLKMIGILGMDYEFRVWRK